MRKKLRGIEGLREKKDQGEEINEEQQAKLDSEQVLRFLIQKPLPFPVPSRGGARRLATLDWSSSEPGSSKTACIFLLPVCTH